MSLVGCSPSFFIPDVVELPKLALNKWRTHISATRVRSSQSIPIDGYSKCRISCLGSSPRINDQILGEVMTGFWLSAYISTASVVCGHWSRSAPAGWVRLCRLSAPRSDGWCPFFGEDGSEMTAMITSLHPSGLDSVWLVKIGL